MVGNATMGQLFNQPTSAVYKVIQSLKSHKVLLMWTTLPFISAVFCIISVCQLLFITSFLIIFIACLLERQNFQAKMGPGVTKHNIYKSYSLSNNQSNLFRTCGKSQWVWVYSLHAFNFFLFVIPRFLVNTGRMKELVKGEISVTKVYLYQFQSWPPNTNQY